MKKLIFLLFIVTNVYLNAFTSFHQKDYYGNYGAIEQMKYASEQKYGGEFYRNFTLSQFEKTNASGKCTSNGYTQYKFYVPQGLSLARISLVAQFNTNYKMYIKFGETSGMNIVNAKANKGVYNRYDTYYQEITDTGGFTLYGTQLSNLLANGGFWMYVAFVNDTPIRPSSYFNNTPHSVAMTYRVSFNDITAFNNWLKTVYVQSNGDPVASTSSMPYTTNSCTNGISTTSLSLPVNGSLYNGSGTYEPEPEKTPEELCLASGNKWLDTAAKCVTEEVYNCEEVGSGVWNSSESRCMSQAEVDCDAIATTKWQFDKQVCLDKNFTLNAEAKDGYWLIPNFYADNSNWETTLSIRNLNTNVSLARLIKIQVQESVASTDGFSRYEELSGSEIWSALVYEENNKVYIEDKTASATKSEIIPKLNYGVIKIIPQNTTLMSELQVDAEINYVGSSSTSSSSSSTSSSVSDETSARKTECENAGNTWAASINQCLVSNPNTSSSSSSATTVTSSNKQAECEARGINYTWNSGAALCMYSAPVTSSSSSSVQSDKEEECKSRGSDYTWNSGAALCLYSPSKASEDEVDLEEEPDGVTDEDKRKVVSDVVATKTFAINGYFIHFDSGVYDWVYVNSDGSLIAKLTGIDENGNLTWEILRQASQNIELLSGATFNDDFSKVSFGSELTVPGRSSTTANQLADKTYKTTGFFIHYGSGSYDWIYTSTNGSIAAKLTGLDTSTGNLTWLWLEGDGQHLFSSINMIDNKEILFGSTN